MLFFIHYSLHYLCTRLAFYFKLLSPHFVLTEINNYFLLRCAFVFKQEISLAVLRFYDYWYMTMDGRSLLKVYIPGAWRTSCKQILDTLHNSFNLTLQLPFIPVRSCSKKSDWSQSFLLVGRSVVELYPVTIRQVEALDSLRLNWKLLCTFVFVFVFVY